MSYFPTTHWSQVANAGHGSVETAKQALEQLYRVYAYPLYAYARWQGDSPQDAEDLVQGFFVEILEKNLIAKAQPEKGRFRSFLLKSFTFHRSKHRERLAAAKRGSGVQILSWDEFNAEDRFGSEPADDLTPERRYERDWAISVLDEAHKRLANDYAKSGKKVIFDRLRGLLQSAREMQGYGALAAGLGKTEAAIKMEVSRMRTHYGRLLREVVGETVTNPGEVEEELRYLLGVLSG